jgi:hypothetical protein
VIIPEEVDLGGAAEALRTAVDVLVAGVPEVRPEAAGAVRASADLAWGAAAACRTGAGAAGSFDCRLGIGFAGTGTDATASGGATRRKRESRDRRDPSPTLPSSTPCEPTPCEPAARDFGAVAVRARPAAWSARWPDCSSAPPVFRDASHCPSSHRTRSSFVAEEVGRPHPPQKCSFSISRSSQKEQAIPRATSSPPRRRAAPGISSPSDRPVDQALRAEKRRSGSEDTLPHCRRPKSRS